MNKISIKHAQETKTINPHLYGHFAEHLGRCIYGGIWVGEDSPIPNTRGIRNDIIAALKQINIPNLRWPGGCFADDYHWKNGIGPKSERPHTINNTWGYVVEDNSFGTHEFLDLCDLIGCEPFIAGNVGSGTAHEMQEWIEYLTYAGDSTLANLRRQNGREEPWDIKFWGVGNENWGCGGHMTPEYYGDLYTRFQTFIRDYGNNGLMKIAGGYGGSDVAGEDLQRLLKYILKRRFPVKTDGVSVHFYVYLRNDMHHSATKFGEAEWIETLEFADRIDHVIQENKKVLDEYDPDNKMWLIIDEWGTWYPVEEGTNPAFLYQQNSLRDAVVAALTLHIFQKHCDRVQLANLAQTVNVLQALILTEDEKMLLTPTYHVFDMFKAHHGATPLDLKLDCDGKVGSLTAVNSFASQSADGKILLTLTNLDPNNAYTFDCDLGDISFSSVEGILLTADEMTAHNTFDNPDNIKPVAFSGARIDGDTLKIDLPSKSVVALTLS